MPLETTLRPRGPYSLAQSARRATDRTRHFRDGLLTCVFEAGGEPALARVWQVSNGELRVRLESRAPDAALETLRFTLACADDHSEFLRRFGTDPLIGRATSRLRGLRPLRTATVTHSLLRALCGQLISAREARRIEARLVARYASEHAGLSLPPTRDDFAPHSPAALCASGLVARKAAALVRISRAWDLERLRLAPTPVAVRRLVEERTLGPWSAGVICLEGLGRYEHGLVGDLGLIKLCRSLLGREATADDTAQLLAHYGEWQGLASVYLLAGAAWVPPPTSQGTVEGRERVEAFHREEPRGRLGPRRRGEHTRT
jgi:3-methyladenine DNA glycosylase/8-oxoguanine DNA glycosylase